MAQSNVCCSCIATEIENNASFCCHCVFDEVFKLKISGEKKKNFVSMQHRF